MADLSRTEGRERFVIEGLGGERALSGSIPVRGAKNMVLKSMAASLLFSGPVTLTNVPGIEDVSRMGELLEALGATVSREGDRCTIDTSTVRGSDLDDALARTLRASIVLAGPLLARFGSASFPHPGGDIIGPRPINLFIDGFRQMGCEVSQDGEHYHIAAKQGLKGADIFFMFVSVTATETLMMAAVGAEGTTTLRNAAMEPEIVALAEYLQSCGANISGAGTPTITIEGLGKGAKLAAKGEWRTIPDRIEAGSFLLLGALAAKELTVTECEPLHLDMLIQLLKQSGIDVSANKDSITVRGGNGFERLHIRTHEYPGFATDLQPPMLIYLTQANGESTIFETIWGGRLNYIQDLVRMGADITLWNPQQVSIKGPTPLVGRTLESPDIRAGLAFLMAAAIAEGSSQIEHVYHIDRGYERIEERLANVGLNIKRQTV
jgi:UDP-N-acetylglucosamine 1-carboxyvinyltransferase